MKKINMYYVGITLSLFLLVNIPVTQANDSKCDNLFDDCKEYCDDAWGGQTWPSEIANGTCVTGCYVVKAGCLGVEYVSELIDNLIDEL